MPIEQQRNIRLTQAHAFGRHDLDQLLGGDGPLKAGYQFRFKQMGFGIGEAEIGKYVLRAAPNASVWDFLHRSSPLVVRHSEQRFRILPRDFQ